jgi:CheY-like chemotaxis protein
MSVSREIAQHIPYLRRFARALTGSREGGDAYVVATLETLIADPAKFESGEDLRGALYRLFLDIWTATPINSDIGGVASEEIGAHRNLDAISLRPRIAFLLNALEGFDFDRVASVLEVSEPDARHLIDLANREISDQIATEVLIIEDEPLIALDLRAIVEELGHHVIAVARTHKEAVALIAAGRAPGLILADIQLADGSSGLDAVNEILASLSTPVIFITAYPERFLTGEPPEPAFLLAKPFAVDSLKAVISQALFFDKKSRPKAQASANGAHAS